MASRLEEPPIFTRLKMFVSRSQDEATRLKKEIQEFENDISNHNTLRDDYDKAKKVFAEQKLEYENKLAELRGEKPPHDLLAAQLS